MPDGTTTENARAFWLCAPGRGEIRPVALPEPGRGDVLIRTLRTGISRGTETLVFRGGVPPRAPFQDGDFPGPVKYGYLSVGAVEQGPPELRSRRREAARCPGRAPRRRRARGTSPGLRPVRSSRRTRAGRFIPWSTVGDGSIFARFPPEHSTQAALLGDAKGAREAYGYSIEYSMRALLSFVARYGADDLVLVVLGDHQPASLITGEGAGHDVPVSIIAHDPTVIDQIAGWGWQDGMRPSPHAPVWPMAAFRDRFLTAFGS